MLAVIIKTFEYYLKNKAFNSFAFSIGGCSNETFRVMIIIITKNFISKEDKFPIL